MSATAPVIVSPEPEDDAASGDTRLAGGVARTVLALCLLHVILSVLFHYDRAWQGDEWGSYLSFRESYTTLFTHFGTWISMNFYLAGLKAIHDQLGGTNWLLVIPGIGCGALLVWLVARLTREVGGSDESVVTAAVLVAINPFLVGYSVTIRSYIFLACFSTAMMLSLWSWRRSGAWSHGVTCGAAGALALFFHLNAVYSLSAAAVLAIAWSVRLPARPNWRKRAVRLGAPTALMLGLVAAAYVPQVPDIRRTSAIWSNTPPTSLGFLPTMVSMFFGDGWILVPTLGGLVYSAWRSCHDRRQTQWLLLAVLVSIASVSVAGISHFPWAYSRFLIATLPLLLVLIADGLWASPPRWRGVVFGAVATIALCNLVALNRNREEQHRYPWHRIADFVKTNTTPESLCVFLGTPIDRMALTVYGVQTDDLRRVIQAAPPGGTLHLVLVIRGTDAAGILPSRAFRGVVVLTIQDTPREIAEKLATDLTMRTAGSVSQDLTEIYGDLEFLMTWIGRPEEAARFKDLGQKCRSRSDRVRFSPPQLQLRKT